MNQKNPSDKRPNTHTFTEFCEYSNILKWKLSAEDVNNPGKNFKISLMKRKLSFRSSVLWLCLYSSNVSSIWDFFTRADKEKY